MLYYIDDIRPTPEGWTRYRTVNGFTSDLAARRITIDRAAFSFDHDAGDYEPHGGDYINALRSLVMWANAWRETPAEIRFHSDNPVGVENMRAIVRSAIKVGMVSMRECDGTDGIMIKGSFINV